MNKTKKHFDIVAKDYDRYKTKNKFYYDNLKKLLISLIPPQKIVLEIGCGTGDLLASLNPRIGYGIDISPKMIKIAKNKHRSRKSLSYSTQSILKFKNKKLDYIFMSDVIEHLSNPQEVFNQVSQVMTKDTVFINTMANPKWEPILMLAEKLGLKMPEGDHYRYSFKEIKPMLKKSKLKITHHDHNLLLPVNIPVITSFINKNFFNALKNHAFIEYFVATKP